MTKEERAKYYDFEKYLRHIPPCTGGGDQSCQCHMAQTRENLIDLLDELEKPEEAK